MNTLEHPLALASENNELPEPTESHCTALDTRKPYIIPALMEPQDMLETTKFFFQVGSGGSLEKTSTGN